MNTKSINHEKGLQLGREEETLLMGLKKSLPRLPDEDATRVMETSHRSSISFALHSHGEPFGRHDWIILCFADLPELRIPIAKLPATIGSKKGDADYIVKSPGVSRIHCQLDSLGPFVKISDYASKNGIFLNDRRVAFGYLSEGDEILMGTVRCKVKRG